MKLLWLLLVLTHGIGCIAVLLCGLAMPLYCVSEFGWRSVVVWLPLGTLLVQMSFDRSVRCVLTDLENWMREKLGKPRITGFVDHYFLGQ